MKKILYIFALLVSVCSFAQQQAPQADPNHCNGWLPGYPNHYCECRETSQVFSFPLEVQVTDTMWFSTTVEDMRQGLSAYWFANCSITFEVYAFCSSKTPTIVMTVGANQMREMDVATINQKLEEMGDMAELINQTLIPRIKVYPNGGTGTVYCYPYDQGPLSTCDSILPIIPRMTYVCSDSTEVYELKPSRIASNGKGFIRWKQKKNYPCSIRLTEGSCDGPEMAHMTLADSMRVMVLNPNQMKAAKTAGNSVFVHVTHPADYVGRIMYRNTLNWDEQRIDTTICQGKSLQLTDTVLTQTTVYPNDTLWKAGDTLSLTTYHLNIEPPTPQQDTLLFKAVQLPTTYHNQYIAKEGWGDYDFTVHQAGECDERYLLHVEHNYVTNKTEVDTTLCLGKTIKINNVTYSKDTVIHDSVWTYAPASNATPDTYTIRHITIHFTEPDVEYDTISVLPSKMTSRGYWYAGLGVMVPYGDTLIVKKKTNTCTRYIQLHVDKSVIITEADTDTTLCQGRTIMFNDVTYTTDTTFYDTIQVDADTWQRGMISIHFEDPVTEQDTLIIAPGEMTQDGYWYDNLGVQLATYGDTLIVKEAKDECTRWIQLHFAFDTTAIILETDTTLCLGKRMMIGEQSYIADTMIIDSAWIDPGLWQIHYTTIRFNEPEMEYDSISLTRSQIDSTSGYWYDRLEVMVTAFGDTLITKTAENECTRWIQLHVEEEQEPPHEAIEVVPASTAGTYKYLREGMLYIRREGQEYDLLGRPVRNKQ